jgi:putative ABC transport system permease protein
VRRNDNDPAAFALAGSLLWPWTMGILHDVRLSARGLAARPGFTVVALATLALGIGANTAIFTVLRAILLRPLPFPDATSLVAVGQSRERGDVSVTSYLDFADWRRDTASLAELAAWHDDALTFVGDAGPQRLLGVASSSNLFTTLGVTPAIGRGFAADEDQAGKNRVVVLSWQAWQRLLGGDRAAVGRTIRLDDTPYTLLGILPQDFRFPVGENKDAFTTLPRPWDDAMIPHRAASYLRLIGRLAPGATLATAQAELDAEAARQAIAYPDDSAHRFVTVRSLQSYLVAGVRPALLVLFGAVGFVLLIACVNVANLLLARATSRHREVAIRVALGAGRGRVVRELLVDSLVLSLAGAALGVLLALWSLDALHSLIPAEALALRPIAIDGGVLAFSLIVAVTTGIVFGIYPALQASSADPQEALRDGGRGSAGPRHQRARSALVVAEIAFAAVLLVGAALTAESFRRLANEDPGFPAGGLVTANVFLPDTRYHGSAASIAFYRKLEQNLAALPGVTGAAIAFPLPFSNMNISLDYVVDGEAEPPPGQGPSAAIHPVSVGYFATLGVPVKGGRTFVAADDRADAPAVAVIDETLARRHFHGADAVGRRLRFTWSGREETYEIIGVAGDVRGDGGQGLDAPAPPEIYIPFGRTSFPFMTFAIRTRADGNWPRLLAGAVQSIDAAMPVNAVTTMDESVRGSMARQRLSAVLLGIFGGLAVVLALIGVYGVMSYAVAQRRQEIGIRMALGARAPEVTRMIVGHTLRLAAVGAGVGLAAALALGQVLARLLYGVTPTEPAIFAATGPFLVAVCVLAAYLPARRAARTDPMVALRSD